MNGPFFSLSLRDRVCLYSTVGRLNKINVLERKASLTWGEETKLTFRAKENPLVYLVGRERQSGLTWVSARDFPWWGIQESDFGVSVELKNPAIIIKMSLLVCFHRLRGLLLLTRTRLGLYILRRKNKASFSRAKRGSLPSSTKEYSIESAAGGEERVGCLTLWLSCWRSK